MLDEAESQPFRARAGGAPPPTSVGNDLYDDDWDDLATTRWALRDSLEQRP